MARYTRTPETVWNVPSWQLEQEGKVEALERKLSIYRSALDEIARGTFTVITDTVVGEAKNFEYQAQELSGIAQQALDEAEK